MMIRTLSSLAILLLIAGCSGGDQPGPAAPGGTTGGGDQPTESGNAEDDHGTPHDLGNLTIPPFSMAVTQYGEVAAGKEAAFDLQFAADANTPEAVRGWIGIASGVGSRKAKFMKELGNKLHGHPEAPDPMPDDARLWIEFDLDAGPQRGSVALHK